MNTDAYTQGSVMVGGLEADAYEYFKNCDDTSKVIFIRGYFDANGILLKNVHNLTCSIKCQEVSFLSDIHYIIGLPSVLENNVLCYTGLNVIEFLHCIYKDATYPKFNYKFATYRELLYYWTPNTRFQQHPHGTLNYHGDGMCFRYMKTLPDAIAPCKAHVSDTGYDLCLVKKIKEENGCIMYDTGIAVQPPFGMYFELVPRSSISKTGYIFANSIGIIDASYTGSLRVALIKVSKDAKELELPCRIAQLIPRQLIHLDAIEVENLDGTKRGEGGFGSSGQGVLN